MNNTNGTHCRVHWPFQVFPPIYNMPFSGSQPCKLSFSYHKPHQLSYGNEHGTMACSLYPLPLPPPSLPAFPLPSGPKPWPIIGNPNLIGPIPHHSLHQLSQKYGPIMHLTLGLKHVVVVSSADGAKAFLKTHGKTFSSRPKATDGKYTTYDYSDMLWAPYSPHWLQARKMYFTQLLLGKSIGSNEYIRKEEMKNMLNELFISSGKPLLLKDYLYSSNLNIISRMVLGKKYVEKDQSGFISWEEFRDLVDEYFLLNSFLNIGDLIPWLNFLDLQGYTKRMKDFSAKFDRFLEHVLNEHEERRKGVEDYVAKDMVDVLLKPAEDPTLEVKASKAPCQSNNSGPCDSCNGYLQCNCRMGNVRVVENPETLRKATEELDRVIGREKWVEEKDMANLPYIEAITKESMRLHPPLTVLPPKVATNRQRPYNMGKPNEFKPKRFICKDIDVKGHHFELLPFGAGRRICAGYPLALQVVQICAGYPLSFHGACRII